MNELVFEALKVIIMGVVAAVCVYLIPLIKKKIGNENLSMMESWAANAVMSAQQWIESDNLEKKMLVSSFLKKIRDENKINITDEQIDILIEAAVKQMKMNDVSIEIEEDIQVDDVSDLAENPEEVIENQEVNENDGEANI